MTSSWVWVRVGVCAAGGYLCGFVLQVHPVCVSYISVHVFLCPNLCVCAWLYLYISGGLTNRWYKLHFSICSLSVCVSARTHVCVFHPTMTILSENYFSSLHLTFLYTRFFFLSHPSLWFALCLNTVSLIYIHSQTESPRSPAFVQHVALTETSDALCGGPILAFSSLSTSLSGSYRPRKVSVITSAILLLISYLVFKKLYLYYFIIAF